MGLKRLVSKHGLSRVVDPGPYPGGPQNTEAFPGPLAEPSHGDSLFP